MPRPFHVTFHRRPPGEWPAELLAVEGTRVSCLRVPVDKLVQPFPSSFEQVAERLAAEPRLFFEPDGSFVWTSEDPAFNDGGSSARWQLDGVVYDRDGHVLYIELKGSCPAAALHVIAEACGVGPQEVVVQSIPAAVTIELPDFTPTFCRR